MIQCNYQLTKQNLPVCEQGTMLLFNRFWFKNLPSDPQSYRAFRETGPGPLYRTGLAHAFFPHKIFVVFIWEGGLARPAETPVARALSKPGQPSSPYKHNEKLKKKQGLSQASPANRAGSPHVTGPKLVIYRDRTMHCVNVFPTSRWRDCWPGAIKVYSHEIVFCVSKCFRAHPTSC